MANKVIKAKNVVSFSTGEVLEQTEAAVAAPEEESSVLKQVDEAIEKIEEAASRLDEAEAEAAELREAVETKPLNLRNTSRYLDAEPQDDDWEEDEPEGYDDFAEGEPSTFTEVFIPVHTDTAGAVVRKGMVLVSLVVILCCIVALVMRTGSVSGVISPDLSAWTDQAACIASAVRLDL